MQFLRNQPGLLTHRGNRYAFLSIRIGHEVEYLRLFWAQTTWLATLVSLNRQFRANLPIFPFRQSAQLIGTASQVVPEFLRTLVFARPRGDDQFADCTFSPSLDMSR